MAEKKTKTKRPVSFKTKDGMFKVKNLYVEVVDGDPKLIFEWDDEAPQ